MFTTRNKCEPATAYAAEAYVVRGYSGIAFYVLGWETEPDKDTEWSGTETRNGNLIAVMVGDDRRFSVDPEDVTAIQPDDYCHECGQIGCGHGLAVAS